MRITSLFSTSNLIFPFPSHRRTFSDLYGPGHDLLHVHLLTLLTGEVLIQRPPTGIFWEDRQTQEQPSLKGIMETDVCTAHYT